MRNRVHRYHRCCLEELNEMVDVYGVPSVSHTLAYKCDKESLKVDEPRRHGTRRFLEYSLRSLGTGDKYTFDYPIPFNFKI